MALRSRATRAHAWIVAALAAHPWGHWLVVYALLLPFFTAYRGVALGAMLRVFATPDEATRALKAAALTLGAVEDALLVTLLLALLSAVDSALGPRRSPSPVPRTAKPVVASVVVVPESSHVSAELPSPRPPPPQQQVPDGLEPDEPIVSPRFRRHVLLQGRRVVRVAVHFGLVALALVPFAVDTVLLRTRGMRFTFEFVNTYIRERDYTAGVEVSRHEVRVSTQTSCVTLAVVVAVVGITMGWLDLSRWHLARLWGRQDHDDDIMARSTASSRGGDVTELSKDDAYASMEDGVDTPTSPHSLDRHDGYVLVTEDSQVGSVQLAAPPSSTSAATGAPPSWRRKIHWKRVTWVVATPLVVLAAWSGLLLVVTHNIRPVVSATAMNASLNELFRMVFGTEFIQSLGDGSISAASDYIDTTTESYELFRDDVLFRKTTGFQGPLAFDVAVNASDPPNVLVLVVESFRYQDSLYLLGNKSDALVQKVHNVSLTPNFDRWAQRGIALRNLWSSWQTSRSVESILFGQVPFDDITDTGTTHGRAKVELHGMPQLFHAKGYETSFTSGVRLKYDQWNEFMPTHGFDYVMGSTAFKAYGEKDYGIKPSDWRSPKKGGQGRASFWGVHDDVSFEVLGDLMINKTNEQRVRLRLEQPKKPFFINHYTISSHTPFVESPEWFASEKLPDFSALAENHPAHADEIMRYAKLRYFEDLALGQFLDRMEREGVLNDTIVVITGDHGQSPERGLERPDVDEIATTRVAGAILAEGRLGDKVGMVYDEACEHYDLLNTLADIVGVPDGGFLQSGVGRSLKRAAPEGERPVWTNNPMRQLAVVKGHKRLSFDRRFNMIELYDAEADPDETQDLLPGVTEDERHAWESLREQSRKLSRYFRVRWDKKCISKVEC